MTAYDKYIRIIIDYNAQYYVLLDEVDTIVFTADIGENNIQIRRDICEKLTYFGIKIDLYVNNTCGKENKDKNR